MNDLQLVPSVSQILVTPIPKFEGEPRSLFQLAKGMYNIMVYPRNGMIGMGLSANQVGQSVRMFIMLNTNRPEGFGKILTCINPEIYEQTDEKTMDESCLSFPNDVVKTKRANRILASWTTLKGVRREEEFYNTYAQCFAHELDHLNGITMHERKHE